MKPVSVSGKTLLWSAVALSVFLRCAAAIYMGNTVEPLPGIFDQISYHNLALRVLGGHGFTFGETWWPVTAANAPTAHWSFLYTFFLTAVYAIAGPHPLAARLIQALVCGVFQPLLAFLIGRRVFNQNVGLIAAFLTAVYAYFVYYSGALMTEPFFITSVLACIYLSITWDPDKPGHVLHMFGLGLVFGTAVLLRQLFLFLVPFFLAWLGWANRKHGWKSSRSAVLASIILPALMILPFTLYNTARFHRFVLLNTNAGYAFFWANHPIYGTRFIEILPPEMGDYVSLIPQDLRSLDEPSLEQELMKQGANFIIEDPGRYVLLSLSRIPAYFKFWPSPDSGLISNIARVGSFGILWPFMLAGLVLAVGRRKTPFLDWTAAPVFMLVVFFLVYTGIHLLSWALIRYRLPVDAVLIVFAAHSINEFFAYITRRKIHSQTLKETGSSRLPA